MEKFEDNVRNLHESNSSFELKRITTSVNKSSLTRKMYYLHNLNICD